MKNRINALRSYFSQLDQREWMIFGGSFLGIILIIALIMFGSLQSSISKIEKIITQGEKLLAEVESDSKAYANILAKSHDLEKKMGQPMASLATFLEKSASSQGITIESIKPKSARPSEFFTEDRVEVKINKVALVDLVAFLYKIETQPQLLRITHLNIKPRYSSPAYLNVIFSVSSYELKQAGGGGE